jgi:hypothetical protein
MRKLWGTRGASGTRALAWMLVGVAALAGCELSDEMEPPGESIGEESQELRGANVGGANLSGANVGGANLGGSNLGGANLGGTNLGGANLGGANLGGTNLAGNNLGGNNLSGTNLGGANLGGANLGGANLGGANLASAGLSGSSVTGSYPGLGCPISGTRNLGTDLTLSTTALDIHNLGSVANKLLRSGEDVHGRASSCVVLGIGSTALARLISQNSGSTLYAAVRTLPWGFASSAGGPVTLTAWEVVVWGSARYAVFIVAAPTTATFEGVAGFLKAVWRWSAPTSKTLKIGQVGGGKPVQTHPGMMDTGTHVLAGTISEKAYVGGQLAFIAATTNTVSVDVDFAAWVRKNDKNPLILANVAGAPGWNEGSFIAIEYADGSVGVTFEALYDRFPASTFGSVKTLLELEDAYDDYLDGRRATAPVPKRCAGYLILWAYHGVPVPAGRCDGPVVSNYAKVMASSSSTNLWSQLLTSPVMPYNSWMEAERRETFGPQVDWVMREYADQAQTIVRGSYPILSETYIHLNEASYAPYP